MLAEKNGLKSVWRSPGKAALFLALLLALTAVLSLGLCIYSAVSGYLADCDGYYRTIANLEYMGLAYNDDTVYDRHLADILAAGEPDLDALSSLPGVLSWEPNRSALGILEGLHRKDSNVYDPDVAVILVGNLFWEASSDAYMGYIRECLYSQRDTSGKSVYVSPLGLGELLQTEQWNSLDTESTRTYVFAGRYVSGGNGCVWFLPEGISIESEGGTLSVPAGMPLPEGQLPEDSLYHLAAQAMAHRTNGLRVQLTGDLENFYPFQQQELYVTEGRSFTREEYDTGARVCVLSQNIASAMEISVGDTVQLSLNFPRDQGIFDTLITQAAGEAAYTVVGLFNPSDQYMDYVFVPDSPDYTPSLCPTGYTLGQFHLENAKAAEFEAAAQALLPPGFRVTVFDQGYAVTAAPFRELLRIAQIFLSVCCLAIAAVLSLYGYLFVYRQREAARTMFALGSGRAHVYRYFAAGSGALALIASLLGALASRQLERRVLSFVAEFARKYQAADLRYSSSNLSVSKELAFDPRTPGWLFLLGAGIMVLAALLACALFTRSALHGKKKRKKQPRAPNTARSSHLSGPLKYPILSIRRGGIRTAAVVAVALVIALFLGQLTSTAGTYEEQLEAIQENTVIQGYLSDSKGLAMDNLVLPVWQLQEYYETGLLETMDITSSRGNYRFLGIRQDAQGTIYQVPCQIPPTSTFAAESLQAQMRKEPKIIATTSIDHSPEFYYASGAEVTWLEGYDARCFHGPDAAVCVLPRTMMEREGIALGSIIRIFVSDRSGGFWNNDLYVVGSYLPQRASDTIYVPLTYTFPKNTEPGPTVERPAFPQDSLRDYTYQGIPAAFLTDQEDPFLQTYCPSSRIKAISQEDQPTITFGYQDYDARSFRYGYAQVCAVSQELANRLGLSFGSTLELTNPQGFTLEYILVGIYEKASGEIKDLYCIPPVTAIAVSGNYGDDFQYRASTGTSLSALSITCSSAIFTMKNTGDLPALKDTLEALNVTSPGQRATGANRSFLVIDDKDYNSTVSSLRRQIQYLDALYKCLYALAGLIGFTVSCLLVSSRKGELAIMRGLGAQPGRIFAVFFSEQLFLSVLGCALGMGLWAALGRPMEPLYPLLTAAFLLCWALGSAISTVRLLGSRALAVLSDRE